MNNSDILGRLLAETVVAHFVGQMSMSAVIGADGQELGSVYTSASPLADVVRSVAGRSEYQKALGEMVMMAIEQAQQHPELLGAAVVKLVQERVRAAHEHRSAFNQDREALRFASDAWKQAVSSVLTASPEFAAQVIERYGLSEQAVERIEVNIVLKGQS